jgi:hypothetical protein
MPKNALAPQPSNALADFYKQNVGMRERTYGESLLKSFTGNVDKPISTKDFTPEELDMLNKLVGAHYAERMTYFSRPKEELLKDAAELDKKAVLALSLHEKAIKNNDKSGHAQQSARLAATQARQLREAAEGKMPTDFGFGYNNYRRAGENWEDVPWDETLGHFRYKIDPKTGEYEAYDKYDFNNPAHAKYNKFYAGMSPPVRLIKSLTDTITGDKFALGEAYLSGENSIPVSIKGRIK